MEELLAHRPLVTQKVRSNENPSPRQVALKTYNDLKGKSGEDDVSSKVKHAALRVLVHRSVVGDAAQRFSPSKSVENGPSIDKPPTTHTLNQSTSITTHDTPPTTTTPMHTLNPQPLSPPSRESAIGVYNHLKNEDELSSNVRVKQAALRTLVQRSVIDTYDKTAAHHGTNEASGSNSNKDQGGIIEVKGVHQLVAGVSSSPSSLRSNPLLSRPVTILPPSEPAVAVPAAVITTKKTATTTTVATTVATTATTTATSSGSSKHTAKPTKTGRSNIISTSLPPTPPAPPTRPLVPSVQQTMNTFMVKVSNNGKDKTKTRARQRAVQACKSQVHIYLSVCVVLPNGTFFRIIYPLPNILTNTLTLSRLEFHVCSYLLTM